MPAKFFHLTRKADKSLDRLPEHIQKKMIHVFDVLQENPLAGAKLTGEYSGYYKIRVGDYRIVYRFRQDISTVEVVKIEHRQGVYK